MSRYECEKSRAGAEPDREALAIGPDSGSSATRFCV